MPAYAFEVLLYNETVAGNPSKFVSSLVNDFEDGAWRYTHFQKYIWDNIAETSLSFRERESLVNKSHSLLVASAKNLRLTDKEEDIGKGSELAEIVLYGLMKDYYGALSVVPKIFYKQNTQDNAKGSDCVHIVLEGDDDFSLWFGEAKFYTSIENARLPSIIDSIENALQTDKLKKENSIITSVSDLDHVVENETLRAQIKTLLANANSIDPLKAKLHVPILILHECSHTQTCSEMTAEYRERIVAHHRERAVVYFSKQAERLDSLHKYSEIRFHIILFPVPLKSEIVDRFVKNVEFYKAQ